MIFPIIFALVGAYFGWNLIIDIAYRIDAPDYVLASIFASMLSLSGVLIGLLLSLLVGSLLPRNWGKPSVYKLGGMKNSNAIRGESYLTRGSVEGGWAYNYYIKEDGCLRPKILRINGNNILIEEIEGSEPRLEVFSYQFSLSWFEWFGILDEKRRYHFYVPKGSVCENFDI